jgi:hypothetical protein
MENSTPGLAVSLDPGKPGIDLFRFFPGEGGHEGCDGRGNLTLSSSERRVSFAAYRRRGTTPMMRFVGLHLWPQGTTCDTAVTRNGRPRFRPLGGDWQEAPFSVDLAEGKLVVTAHGEAVGGWEYTLVVEYQGATYTDVAQSVLTVREPLPADPAEDDAVALMSKVA